MAQFDDPDDFLLVYKFNVCPNKWGLKYVQPLIWPFKGTQGQM